jgi:tagatose-1,6-bisphosphate aldolase
MNSEELADSEQIMAAKGSLATLAIDQQGNV